MTQETQQEQHAQATKWRSFDMTLRIHHHGNNGEKVPQTIGQRWQKEGQPKILPMGQSEKTATSIVGLCALIVLSVALAWFVLDVIV